MQNDMGPAPAFTTEWQTLKYPPRDTDRPIMVYWEIGDECFLDAGYSFQDGKFYNEDYAAVRWPPDVTRLLWAYWPNPRR